MKPNNKTCNLSVILYNINIMVEAVKRVCLAGFVLGKGEYAFIQIITLKDWKMKNYKNSFANDIPCYQSIKYTSVSLSPPNF